MIFHLKFHVVTTILDLCQYILYLFLSFINPIDKNTDWANTMLYSLLYYAYILLFDLHLLSDASLTITALTLWWNAHRITWFVLYNALELDARFTEKIVSVVSKDTENLQGFSWCTSAMEIFYSCTWVYYWCFCWSVSWFN